MTQPLVSVVIPAYQAQLHLGAAVSSALSQTYPDVEVIVTDDGSSDATGAIATSYGELVRVVRQPNGGLSSARNAAIAQARGELVALLDADDILLPPYLDAAVARWRATVADHGPRSWVCSDAYILSSAGLQPNRRVLLGDRPSGDAQRRAVLERNFVTVFSVFPRRLWVELDGFDESMGVCEDYDLWARAIFAGWRVGYQPEPQALYRRSAGSLSTQSERMYRGEEQVLAHIDERHRHELTAGERDYLDLRRRHGSTVSLVDASEAALRSGDVRAAAGHLRTAARLSPGNRRLRVKAAALGVAPGLATLYRRRQRRRDTQLGTTAP